MRYTVLIAAVMAVAAMAKPVDLEKRRYVTKHKVVYVTEYDSADAQRVTVTAPTVTRTVYHGRGRKYFKRPSASPKPSPSPEPVIVEPVPEPSPEPAPAPSPEPAPEPAPSPEPVPEPAPEPIPEEEEDNSESAGSEEEEQRVEEPAPSTGNSVRDVSLAVHNKYRALHGVPALEWDDNLAALASQDSAGCGLGHTRTGQNLYWGVQDGDVEPALAGWYEEICGYDFNADTMMDGKGHFTQMVWKSATKVGCAFNPNCGGIIYGNMYTCNYDEGNLQGSFRQNVLVPSSMPSKCSY